MKELKFKKEIIANLESIEASQVVGGETKICTIDSLKNGPTNKIYNCNTHCMCVITVVDTDCCLYTAP
ncbi:MAG: hypothetical protein ACEPOV_02020 [Hyphomicrobiales bacterium]